MIITISGLAGTGTTSVSTMLKKKLGYEYIYAGQIFRDEAKKLNMNIGEFASYLSDHPDLDKDIDQRMVTFAKKHPNAILEGRLSAWMIERAHISAIKILLTAPLSVSADRVAKRDNMSLKEATEKVKERDTVDRKRYLKLYNIDIEDNSVYDISFDTSQFTLEEEVESILEYIKGKDV